ncbi:Glutamate-rich protein 1 [Sciurus carolinensis]|uniref:Glutamate-rich protein 1 n=1 Tax=Sciurus carolinensis TaxID=30640 RepID=A0AA41SUL6_SCICA|nr:Glutamate-rich protein 1 [Sciurus carolinensis]
MSKNKKRKLKKKQHIRRKKAAGLVTKASGVSVMYQPGENCSEQEDLRGLRGGLLEESNTARRPVEKMQEDVETNNRKAEGILNLLKSTQDIYLEICFYDGFAPDADSAVRTGSAKLLLHCPESHSMPPSDVFILDHTRTLKLLHHTERWRRALESFPEHYVVPPDHARVISAFFNYWITHIFPEKDIE